MKQEAVLWTYMRVSKEALQGGRGPWKCSKMSGNTNGLLRSVSGSQNTKISWHQSNSFISDSYHFYLFLILILVYKSLKPVQILSPMSFVSKGKSCGFCANWKKKVTNILFYLYYFHTKHVMALCVFPFSITSQWEFFRKLDESEWMQKCSLEETYRTIALPTAPTSFLQVFSGSERNLVLCLLGSPVKQFTTLFLHIAPMLVIKHLVKPRSWRNHSR